MSHHSLWPTSSSTIRASFSFFISIANSFSNPASRLGVPSQLIERRKPAVLPALPKRLRVNIGGPGRLCDVMPPVFDLVLQVNAVECSNARQQRLLMWKAHPT